MAPSTRTVFVAAMVTALVAAPVAAAGFVATPTGSQPSDVAPGAKLAGSVSVQGAELNGEVAERTFGVKIRNANDNRSKAAVVATQVADLRTRLTELRERERTLESAHDNGSLSDGVFRARMASVVAETRSVDRLLNDSATVAHGLPEAALEERGVNVSAIETLRADARSLSGPAVAEIARSVAGDDVGAAMGHDRGKATLPDAAKNASNGRSNAGAGGDSGGDGRPGAGNDDGSPGADDGERPGDAGRDGTDTPTPTPDA